VGPPAGAHLVGQVEAHPHLRDESRPEEADHLGAGAITLGAHLAGPSLGVAISTSQHGAAI